MPNVSVIEFTKPGGIYRTGDRAGFEPSLADEYVRRGFGRLVAERVPSIDPSVIASDAHRRLEEVQALITAARRDAESASKSPEATATASEALKSAQTAEAMLAALRQQLGVSGDLGRSGEQRRPSAQARAA